MHQVPRSKLLEHFFLRQFQEYNSLSNLGTLRGVFGAHPGVGVRKAPLARYSLSMRKPCLESYILEISRCRSRPRRGWCNFLKTITTILIDHIDPTKNDHCNFLQVVIFDLCVKTKVATPHAKGSRRRRKWVELLLQWERHREQERAVIQQRARVH